MQTSFSIYNKIYGIQIIAIIKKIKTIDLLIYLQLDFVVDHVAEQRLAILIGEVGAAAQHVVVVHDFHLSHSHQVPFDA